jgi:NAD(P)-dependent dehydrogenase (short-subunit alcohol dehydrogenase family)
MTGAAVVTGGASGIGAACVRVLQEDGYRVAVFDLDGAEGADLSIRVDVAIRDDVERAARRVELSLGPIDVLVTAAGYYERLPVTSIGESWRRMLAVHLDGTVNATRSAYARMLPRARGAICTISSELALCGDADAAHYAAAKGAIIAFTKSLALEASANGIRVNSVAPGPTDTQLMTEEMRDPAYVGSLVLKRLVSPDEVAETVRFVVSDEHNLVGQVISPNAGAVI